MTKKSMIVELTHLVMEHPNASVEQVFAALDDAFGHSHDITVIEVEEGEDVRWI